MFRLSSDEKDIELVLQISDEVPEMVTTDEQRVKQVLLNLLQNALKFTQSGSITVAVDYESDLSNLVVSVIDTGVGISE